MLFCNNGNYDYKGVSEMTKEERKEYIKVWKEKNPDKVKAARKRYYEKHKEQYKEYQKRWNDKNPDKVKEIRHNYYVNNKDKCFEQNREWIENNKKRFAELVCKSRRKRVDKLREQGIKNAWDVVNYGKEPKYKEIK